VITRAGVWVVDATAEAARALDALARDSVVMVEDEDTYWWLAWESSVGNRDFMTLRHDAARKSSAELASLRPFEQLLSTGICRDSERARSTSEP
jgi:hypothetical protein